MPARSHAGALRAIGSHLFSCRFPLQRWPCRESPSASAKGAMVFPTRSFDAGSLPGGRTSRLCTSRLWTSGFTTTTRGLSLSFWRRGRRHERGERTPARRPDCGGGIGRSPPSTVEGGTVGADDRNMSRRGCGWETRARAASSGSGRRFSRRRQRTVNTPELATIPVASAAPAGRASAIALFLLFRLLGSRGFASGPPSHVRRVQDREQHQAQAHPPEIDLRASLVAVVE